jgi:hypothetical protein
MIRAIQIEDKVSLRVKISLVGHRGEKEKKRRKKEKKRKKNVRRYSKNRSRLTKRPAVNVDIR